MSGRKPKCGLLATAVLSVLPSGQSGSLNYEVSLTGLCTSALMGIQWQTSYASSLDSIDETEALDKAFGISSCSFWCCSKWRVG